ncbi:MAG TPA: DUF2946 family protein [Rubrivivax sp.]|nr:DUF2946 family protein [Rubrivivax sp.]
MHSIRRCRAAWLILLMLTLAFVAPGVSRMVAFAAAEMPVGCPLHLGMSTTPSSSPSDDAKTAKSLDACGLCNLAFALPLPPIPASAGGTQLLKRARHVLSPLTPPAVHAGWHKQSRAPPTRT